MSAPVSLFRVTAFDVREAAYGLTIPEGGEADTAIEKAIRKAEVRILERFPNLPERVEGGKPALDVVQGVIEDMVLRVMRNPNGYRQVTLDDYSRTIDSAVSTGLLILTDAEAALLAPPRPKQRRAIGSVRIATPRWRLP